MKLNTSIYSIFKIPSHPQQFKKNSLNKRILALSQLTVNVMLTSVNLTGLQIYNGEQLNGYNLPLENHRGYDAGWADGPGHSWKYPGHESGC
jgi:hypothetical protein